MHATNSLAGASSSYLRSAMHQPIRWFEWGTEAFATAKRENKWIAMSGPISIRATSWRFRR